MNIFEKLKNIDSDILKQKRHINSILIDINPRICIPIIKEVYFVWTLYYDRSNETLKINRSYDGLFYYRIVSDKISFQYSVAAFNSIFDVLFKQSSLTNSNYEYIIENNNYKYYKTCKNRRLKTNRKKYGLGFIHFPDKYDSKQTYIINLNEGEPKNVI